MLSASEARIATSGKNSQEQTLDFWSCHPGSTSPDLM